jgi:excisionase family DNA binding protein
MAETPLMTTKEVATLTQFEPRTVRRWVSMGRLKALRIGHEMRFRRADVLSALERFEYGGNDDPKRDASMG